jgi:two-component system, sensor histidine kinase and response regulator
LRILVVEDNLINQQVATRILNKFECQVDVAANGREALKRVTSAHYDLVLMDCLMPEMDGYQATAAIRKLPPPLRNIPIVAMTASSLNSDPEKCLAAGMNAFLAKPVRAAAMERVLREQIVRSTARPNPGASSSRDETEHKVERPEPETTNGPAARLERQTEVVDRALLSAVSGGDVQFIPSLLDLFESEFQRLAAEISDAINQSSAERVRLSSHELRGILLTIGAREAVEIARRLAAEAEIGAMDRAAAQLLDLEHELADILDALAAEVIDPSSESFPVVKDLLSFDEQAAPWANGFTG